MTSFVEVICIFKSQWGISDNFSFADYSSNFQTQQIFFHVVLGIAFFIGFLKLSLGTFWNRIHINQLKVKKNYDRKLFFHLKILTQKFLDFLSINERKIRQINFHVRNCYSSNQELLLLKYEKSSVS